MADPANLSDDEILAKVKGQPETLQIAESLGMSVDDYAKRVLFYVRNPGKEPMVQVMSDEAAREAGMPTAAECAEFLEAAVEDMEKQENAHYAGFDDDEKSAATTTGGVAKKRAPKLGEARGEVIAGDDDLGRELKANVTDARRKSATSAGRGEAARRKQAKEGSRK